MTRKLKKLQADVSEIQGWVSFRNTGGEGGGKKKGGGEDLELD